MASLQKKDRDLLSEKLQEYSSLYARDGVRGLQLRVSEGKIKHARDFVVRLSNSEGKTLFIHSPDRSDDKLALQLTEIDQALSTSPIRDGWILVPARNFGDDIEVVSKTLLNGDVLRVGKDTEDREDFFKSFTQAYVKGLIPIFILAIFIGAFLSHRILKPIRWLTQTVESIRSGNSKARVPLRHSSHENSDELWRLGNLFNQMLEQNEKLVQGMRDTLDHVAHDMRTPVMRLQSSVETVLSGRPELTIFQEALIDCKENSDLILKLLEGIMDISEAEAGTLPLKKETVLSSKLIDDVIDLYGFVAEDKTIHLVPDIQQSFEMTGDRMRLLQVLSNLVDNALKYSPAHTKVTIESFVENKFGVIQIIDQGKGISNSELPQIWNRLYRGDSSRSSRGLGLGLSLVKAITLAHDAEVGAFSNKTGVGTTFFLKFKITKM